jgi:hypothetical protein
MTTYNFTIQMKTDEPNDVLSEEEMAEITQWLLQMNRWAEVTGITYTP